MQVKCISCGASQVLNENKICSYCGVLIETHISVTAEETEEFELALYEYRGGNIKKALIHFDDLLKKDSNAFIVWIYKIVGTFEKNLVEYNYNKNQISKQDGTILSWDKFYDDISFLVKKGKSKENLDLIEVHLGAFLKRAILTDYNIKANGFTKNIFGLSSHDDFPRFLNNLSKLLSRVFNTIIIKLFYEFFDKFPYTGIIPGSDVFVLMEQLLITDIEISNKLIKKVLDSNIIYLNEQVDGWQKRINAGTDPAFIFLPSERHLKEGANLISALKRKSEVLNFSNLLPEYNSEILIIKNKIESISKLIKVPIIKKKEGCFISTAAMGDYNHPIVMDLRLFRDNWLIKRKWGIKFTNWYYTYGAKAAKVIEKSTFLKKLVYIFIVKPLQIITKKLR
jgi:hypothetical protein